jgi:2-C-methyl-D-erythritol 4-phosphate cytidylyltransferase/2-C-methyl-D-erythritol 2,4-cyclodiphosphate synthase
MGVGVVLAAAGSSQRMGGGTNKILLPLEGMPILAYSLSTFAQCPFVAQIVIVARREDMAAVEGLAQEWGKKVSVVEGGRERQESVYLGLQALGPDIEWVLVHDAARPFVTQEMIENVLAACKEHSAATVAVPVTDTIKVVEGDLVQKTLPRDKLWAVQTPQAFLRELLVSAHQSAAAEGVIVTDDCALVERFGGRVVVVSGDYSNIKITTAADLGRGGGKVAAPLIGYGFDVHRMVTGRRLVLAGVEIPYELGLLGHSDADVAAHAVSDALLGAAGLGDIGDLFPDTDPKYAGADSMVLLGEVVQLLNEHGLRPWNVDLTIVAQKPKLSPWKGKMRRGLGKVLGLPESRVGLKFTTTEGLGFTGRGEGIAAHAVVSLIKV